jgi:hypothetical protein
MSKTCIAFLYVAGVWPVKSPFTNVIEPFAPSVVNFAVVIVALIPAGVETEKVAVAAS